MSTKPTLATRAARLNKHPGPPDAKTAEMTTGANKPAPVVRTKPIRITLDLAPQPHRQLKNFCDELATELGRANVPGAEVFRALLSQLNTDADLRAEVTAHIRENSRK